MINISEFIRPRSVPQDAAQMSRALEAVRRHLDMPLAYLSTFEDDCVHYIEVSADDPACFLQTGLVKPAGETYCKAVRDGLLPELMTDTSQLQAARNLIMTDEGPVGAVICVPVYRKEGQVYGMFCCAAPDPRPSLNMRDHAVMTMFAALAADYVVKRQEDQERNAELGQLIDDTIVDRNFQSLLQPVVHLQSGAVIGAEALSRFRGNGPQTPDMWFSDAARVGREKALELATLEKSLEFLPHLPQGHRLSLNVSAHVLTDPALPRLLDRPRIDRLMVEITEHCDVADIAEMASAMKRLRAMGVSIAMDDLGAGHSALSMMLRLKPDVLKMDRTLVRGVHLDPASQALTKALTYFAGQIGAEVVAEGIEYEAERESLRKLGVHLGQGYLFGRPSTLTDYLRACT